MSSTTSSTTMPAVVADAGGSGWSTTDLGMLVVTLIWGCNFAVVKLTLLEIPTLAFVSLRFVLATAIFLAVLYQQEGSLAFPQGQVWRTIVVGVVGNMFYQLLFIQGLTRTTAANSALLLATLPVAVALISLALRIERVTGRMVAGIALSFGGVALVMAARGAALSLETWRGDLLTLAAMGCWAVYTIGVRPLFRTSSSLRVTTLTMLTGTPGLLLLGLPEAARLDWGRVSGGAWLGLVYSVLLALFVAYLVWNSSVRRVGGTRTTLYMCLTPLIAALTAWLVLGEQIYPLQGVGALLIIGGILLTRSR